MGLDIFFPVILFAILGNLIFSIVVYLHKPGERPNQIFLLFTLSAVVWMISSLLAETSTDPHSSLMFLRIDYAAGLTSGYLLWLFTSYFPQKQSFPSRIQLWIGFIVTVLFGFLTVFTQLVVVGLKPSVAYTTSIPGTLDIVFVVIILFFVLISAYTLVQQYRLSKGHQKLQVQYVSIGLLIPVFFIAIVGLGLARLVDYGVITLPLELLTSLRRTFVITTVFFFIMASAAIIKHKIFGLRVLIGKFLYWVSLAVFYTATIYLIMWFGTEQSSQLFSLNTIIIHVLLIFLSAFTLSIFDKDIQNLINEHLVRFWYDPDQVTEQFIIVANARISSNSLAELVFDTVEKTMSPSKQLILISDTSDQSDAFVSFSRGISDEYMKKITSPDTLQEVLMTATPQLPFYQQEEDPNNRNKNSFLTKYDFAMTLPFYYKN